jgi:hypothetical protein
MATKAMIVHSTAEPSCEKAMMMAGSAPMIGPTSGMKSDSPAITPSATGEGRPMNQRASVVRTPTQVIAMSGATIHSCSA